MIKKRKVLTPRKNSSPSVPTQEYIQTLVDLKQYVQEAQIKATFSANKELMCLYWSIGKIINEKQTLSGWGTKLIEQLAEDLQNTFPGIGGFSRANIFRIKAFFASYEIVAQAVRQFESLPIAMIPWGHNVVLIQKLKDIKQRLWYAQKAIEYGWSRSMLETWIKSDLYNREGKAITNFKHTLPQPESDMAHYSLKDPYIFDFLTLHEQHLEKDVEQGLIDHIQKFLLELGEGFSFYGRQYHLEIGDKDYYIDLLFYHVKLRCFIVIELKAREFEPKDAGQINFYLSAIDDLLRNPGDNPTIGLILCKSKNNFTAEYALRDIKKPIGVAGYETILVESLPKNLKGSLPTIKEIEAELKKQEMLLDILTEEVKKKSKNKAKK
ncbi:MAG TPA: PDDEXK nuclease domain-containing protein [Candidatus Babeliales bacterium]|nr:PDDEXK nuclease domain-containing protein [Candidatus Babeliales bacterium]